MTLLNWTLLDSLIFERNKLLHDAIIYAFGPRPTAEQASLAYDQEFTELLDRISRIEKILRRRYKIHAVDY